jgi:hypothetical protein
MRPQKLCQIDIPGTREVGGLKIGVLVRRENYLVAHFRTSPRACSRGLPSPASSWSAALSSDASRAASSLGDKIGSSCDCQAALRLCGFTPLLLSVWGRCFIRGFSNRWKATWSLDYRQQLWAKTTASFWDADLPIRSFWGRNVAAAEDSRAPKPHQRELRVNSG